MPNLGFKEEIARLLKEEGYSATTTSRTAASTSGSCISIQPHLSA